MPEQHAAPPANAVADPHQAAQKGAEAMAPSRQPASTGAVTLAAPHEATPNGARAARPTRATGTLPARGPTSAAGPLPATGPTPATGAMPATGLTAAMEQTAGAGASAAAGPVASSGQSAAAGRSADSQVDLREGLAWGALGAATLFMSLRMDRLADQGVAAYAAPGLVPGLLGIVMILFGGLVALRVRRKPGGGSDADAEPQERRPELQSGRLLLVIGLCLAFSVGLLGHGLPFWVAASLFVTVSILVLQQPERQAAGRRLDARALLFAGGIGLAAGVTATLVFQHLFLVHLP